MQTGILEKRRMASDLVVAIFHGATTVHDAVSDLSVAGFRDIRIAFSNASGQTERGKKEGEHSLPWKIRHGLERDAHRRGSQQMGSEDEEESLKEMSRAIPPDYTEVDLRETLLELGVAEDRIYLVDYQLGADGVLLLVHAGDRRREAERIVEQNCGVMRTDTVTEPALAIEHALQEQGRPTGFAA